MYGGLRSTGTSSLSVGLAVLFDVIAIVKRDYSIGLRRQTAKQLAHDETRPWWITALFWGLDTGLIWSTFRVSAASWVLIIAALSGLVPGYGGLVYGLAFGSALLVVVLLPERSDEGRPLQGPWLQLAQTGAIATMLLFVASLSSAG